MIRSHLKRGGVNKASEDELHLVDAVLAAFCFQNQGHKLRQPLEVQAVYRAFAELRQKYPAWLQDLRFTYGPTDTVPISGVLEDILFNLGANRIMEVGNPWYRNLKIPAPKLRLIKQAITDRRSTIEQEELTHLANEFFDQYTKVAGTR